MRLLSLIGSMASAGAIGALVAAWVLTFYKLAGSVDPQAKDWAQAAFIYAPLYALMMMLVTIPGTIIVGTPVTLLLKPFGLNPIVRATIFAAAGLLVGPGVWRSLSSIASRPYTYEAMIFGLCCGLACAISTGRLFR